MQTFCTYVINKHETYRIIGTNNVFIHLVIIAAGFFLYTGFCQIQHIFLSALKIIQYQKLIEIRCGTSFPTNTSTYD
jgi:hypothetical protein